MGSAFGRVFSVLVMVLLILSVLAFGGVSLTERVREMAHWNQRLHQLGRVMCQDESPDVPWLNLPGELSKELPSAIFPLAALTSELQYRLNERPLIAHRQSGSLFMWMNLGDDQALKMELGERTDQIVHRLTHFLTWYQHHDGQPSEISIQRLQQWFSVRRLTTEPEELVPVIVLGNHEFIAIGEATQWQSQRSVWVIALVIIYAMACLGLVVYRLVSLVENRLHTLDQTTRRLAQGHLSARVVVRGHDPVSRLGDSFNKTAEHIRRLLDIQREMVRAVSHELRTPISRMTFALENLADMTSDRPDVQRSVRNMDGDLQELEQLVDEILTYARLEEGGPLLEFERTSLEMIARQVVSEARPAGAIRVEFDASGSNMDALAELEPRYLHRAVQNLVGNACRYARSRVLVRCTLTNETCRVDVEDDGPGIPEEDWGRVFTAFARLDDSRTRKSGGFGLGLSIVRRIAYWHGGRAVVGRSEALSGARFSLVWPRYQDDEA